MSTNTDNSAKQCSELVLDPVLDLHTTDTSVAVVDELTGEPQLHQIQKKPEFAGVDESSSGDEPLAPQASHVNAKMATMPVTLRASDDEDEEMVIKPRVRNKRSQITHDEDDLGAVHKKIKARALENGVDSHSNGTNTEIQQEKSQRPVSNEDEDDEGNSKVDVDGALKGDRIYASRAFRLPTRGDTYYFLATEIARVSGYRDSYLLFNKNRALKKLMTTEAEKAYLIANEHIPYSYRSRQIGIVNALSIFKTFGARVVQRGRRVLDDYFEQRARDQGFTSDDFANEEDRPVTDRSLAPSEAQKRGESEAEIALAKNAKSAVEFNKLLNQQRKAREALRKHHFRSKQDLMLLTTS